MPIVSECFLSHYSSTEVHDDNQLSFREDEFTNANHEEISYPKICHVLHENLSIVD